ncbi:MAG: preprotein translocase subunit YajC [Actinobacteria bacterium]|nr:preprotein translocase subunit YajC [Actinomycetota bacterium]
MVYAIAWFALLFVAFYVFVVRPQRRQVTAHRAFVASLEIGDEVITAGGLYGTVRALRDDVVELEVADGVVVRMARAAIARPVAAPVPAEDLDDETA